MTLRCYVSLTEVPLNREFTYTQEIQWDAGAGEYEFTWPDPPECDKLEVTGNSSSSRQKVVDGRTIAVKQFVYRLKPITTGPATIEPVRVEYTNKATGEKRTEKTRFIDLTITKPESSGFSLAWVLVPLGILVAGCVVLAIVIIRGAKPKEAVPQTAARTAETPEEFALHTLAEYDKVRLEGDIKDYCIKVSKLLRQYIEKKYKIAVRNMLTDEVMKAVHSARVPDRVCARIKSIFELSDVIKYSTGQPGGGEGERLKTMVINLMQDLK